MTFVLESLAAIGGATATTAATAATTATTLGTIQSGLTIASAVTSVLGGFMAFRQGQDSARFAGLEAERSEMEAAERSLRIRRETAEKIGATRVAFAGSGLDISGSGAIEAGLEQQSEFEREMALASGRYNAARGRAGAANLESQGTAGLISGIGKGFASVADGILSSARRGLPEAGGGSGAAYGRFRRAQG